MDKKDRYAEFVELFYKSVEEAKKLKSLSELTVTSDSCFGGIVRAFGKGNILAHLAMLAASEIEITNFAEENINKIQQESLEKLKNEFKKYYGSDETDDVKESLVPSKKKDLN